VVTAVHSEQAVDATLLYGVGEVGAVGRGEIGQVEHQLEVLDGGEKRE
jgi:hypothetical protein